MYTADHVADAVATRCTADHVADAASTGCTADHVADAVATRCTADHVADAVATRHTANRSSPEQTAGEAGDVGEALRMLLSAKNFPSELQLWSNLGERTPKDDVTIPVVLTCVINTHTDDRASACSYMQS